MGQIGWSLDQLKSSISELDRKYFNECVSKILTMCNRLDGFKKNYQENNDIKKYKDGASNVINGIGIRNDGSVFSLIDEALGLLEKNELIKETPSLQQWYENPAPLETEPVPIDPKARKSFEEKLDAWNQSLSVAEDKLLFFCSTETNNFIGDLLVLLPSLPINNDLKNNLREVLPKLADYLRRNRETFNVNYLNADFPKSQFAKNAADILECIDMINEELGKESQFSKVKEEILKDWE